MSESDNDETTVHGAPEATPGPDEVSSDDASNDGDDDAEDEATIEVSLSVREALVLLHVAWEKELDMTDNPKKMGLAQVMSGVSMKLGEKVYNENVATWMKEQQEEQEDMMEQLQERMGDSIAGMTDSDGNSRVGFQ